MSTVFRQSALESLDEPDELDALVRTTSRRSWIALAALAALTVLVAVWSVAAQVPVTLSGRAVLVAPDSIRQVYATQAGFVASVEVAPGEHRTAGSPLVGVGPEPNDAPTSRVRAPITGDVAEVMVRRGQYVSSGQQVGVMIRPIQAVEQRALVFVGQEDAARLEPGMTAQVAVDTVDQEVFGTLSGQIETVSRLPYNPAAVEAAVQSVALAQSLPQAAGGTPYLVTVALQTADTPSGFAWALGAGPPSRLPDGALASVTITTARRAPIRFVFGGS